MEQRADDRRAKQILIFGALCWGLYYYLVPTKTTAADVANTFDHLPSTMPAAERSLIYIIQQYARLYEAAENELAAGTLRFRRAGTFCEFMDGKHETAEPWIGKVSLLSSNSSGNGVLQITIGQAIELTTANNEFSDDLGSIKSLVEAGSDIAKVAAALHVGDKVYFKGEFGTSSSEYIDLLNLTQSGAMTEPEILMHFTELELAK